MSDLTAREVKESPVPQGTLEEKTYTFDFTEPGGSPSTASDVILDSKGNDVSAVSLSGSVSVSGNYVTSRTVKTLKAGEVYRLYVKATVSGQVLNPYLVIHCTR